MTKATLRKIQQLRLDSMTGVNPKHTHGIGIWGSERVVMSIRVDKKLKTAFKSASMALFGSTCNPIECYMATIVGLYQNEQTNRTLRVNPSITVDIGEIKIERNLRERRKIVEPEVEKEISENYTCAVGNPVCGKPAVDLLIYNETGVTYPVCVSHRKLGDTKAWSYAP